MVWHAGVWKCYMMTTEQCISGLEVSLCLTSRFTYWPCRAEGVWEHTTPHSLAHMLHFWAKLELAPRSLSCDDVAKANCSAGTVFYHWAWISNRPETEPVGSAQSCPQQELTTYSSAVTNPLLMFLIIPKAITEGRWNQKVLNADDLLGKQNTAAVEVMAGTSVSGGARI